MTRRERKQKKEYIHKKKERNHVFVSIHTTYPHLLCVGMYGPTIFIEYMYVNVSVFRFPLSVNHRDRCL